MDIIKGQTVDARVWAPLDEVEVEAREQVRKIASLPWVAHVAVMPDVHFGKGATVGSVIAMRQAVCPAAVGVDIGCFTGDTLVPVAGGRHVPLRELAGGECVVYACTPSGRIVMARASAKMTRRDAELVEVTLDNDERIRCTPDHEFMLRDGTYCRADELAPGASLMPLYTKVDRDGYTMVQQNYSGRWQKAHWIAARSGLLGPVPKFDGQRTIIHHRDFEQVNNDPSNLEFMGDRDHSTYHRLIVERNTEWQSESFEAARVAALQTKASTPEGRAYFAARGTANLRAYMAERPEHFQAAVAGNGERGAPYLRAYNQSERGRAKSSEVANRLHQCETCGETARGGFGIHNHRKAVHGYNHKVLSVRPLTEREDVYCLTVPEHHNFALSAGVFVHNCGMAAVRTTLRQDWLGAADVQALFDGISRAVPVGYMGHDGLVPDNRLPDGLRVEVREHLGKLRDLRMADAVREQRPHRQMGTLGGGNHFVEVCADEQGAVWIMLHSGSRNIGKELAERHIAVARALTHNAELPDRDLAVFMAGTPEMEAYRHDLYWAQRYAELNRRVMLALVQAVVTERYPLVAFEAPITCHHNYVAEEQHFGEELFVTRKGAIAAYPGMRGIIPGSMGTRSYIVEGLGNPDALASASHGAGRRMSRGAAKRKYTLDDLAAQTEGVVCRKDEGVLDEIPGAYKDVDRVMEQQQDLVRVLHTLRALLCVKG